jgi:soluble lytic murein transglycosylase-like protein
MPGTSAKTPFRALLVAAILAALAVAALPREGCAVPADGALAARERLLGKHFDGPCRKMGVPKALAMAVARQESYMHPFVLNIAGKDVRPKTRAEALRLADRARASGVQYDVGVMQINRYWIRRYGLPHETLLDPRGNIYVGVWILKRQIERHGLTWKAVGTYHSSTPWRRDDYARKVQRHFRNLLRDYADAGLP